MPPAPSPARSASNLSPTCARCSGPTTAAPRAVAPIMLPSLCGRPVLAGLAARGSSRTVPTALILLCHFASPETFESEYASLLVDGYS